ncbi:hypothetical protein Cob_v011693 [Colletotrichum orbiculare MAFF 240422]|uniref:Uncharacterized protein n=1 Tax=Colletotrichum orbiculare (strain 104-T / ATCC 96160 / CBS 514.97 / LARS 414 / MAFF 240422) TaxID=1213857 RepID=A0A484FCN7_COLOR|nr:hypothetical protein Cob_v011693 [Colletotrichum orbiculare MAFF 240422]
MSGGVWLLDFAINTRDTRSSKASAACCCRPRNELRIRSLLPAPGRKFVNNMHLGSNMSTRPLAAVQHFSTATTND